MRPCSHAHPDRSLRQPRDDGGASSSRTTPRCSIARTRCSKQSPLIDGHNDYPWALREKAQRNFEKLDIAKPQPSIMTDIPRSAGPAAWAGSSGRSTCRSMLPGAAVTATLEQIDTVHQMVRRYPETFELALTADDVERIFKKGKIASLIGMEGGHSIDNSLAALRMFYRLGRALHDADALEEHRRGPTRRPTIRSSADSPRSAKRSCAR